MADTNMSASGFRSPKWKEIQIKEESVEEIMGINFLDLEKDENAKVERIHGVINRRDQENPTPRQIAVIFRNIKYKKKILKALGKKEQIIF